LPPKGTVFLSVKDRDKPKTVAVAHLLHEMGYELVATRGTAAALEAAGIPVRPVLKVKEGRPHVVDLLKNGEINLVITTVAENRHQIADSRSIRTTALAQRVTYYTTIAGGRAAVEGMKHLAGSTCTTCRACTARSPRPPETAVRPGCAASCGGLEFAQLPRLRRGILFGVTPAMPIPITAAGAERLKAELQRLKAVERPAIIQAIKEAREKGDLSENAEYDAARERQGFIEGRIMELEGRSAPCRSSTRRASTPAAASSSAPRCCWKTSPPATTSSTRSSATTRPTSRQG